MEYRTNIVQFSTHSVAEQTAKMIKQLTVDDFISIKASTTRVTGKCYQKAKIPLQVHITT
jgi:hypothetical protein